MNIAEGEEYARQYGARAPAAAAWPLRTALVLAAGTGAALAASYGSDPSLATAAVLLSGMALLAWQMQRQAGTRRLACLALSLMLWQLGGMGWVTSVLSPGLAGWERGAAVTLLLALLGLLSVGSLLLLAGALRRLLPRWAAPQLAWPLAWPLAWWAWAAWRDLCWWGGGYGSLNLPLLALPGPGTVLPVTGPAMFEALLWAALLALTRPAGTLQARRRVAVAVVLALALAWPAPPVSSPTAVEGLSIAPVEAPVSSDNNWSLAARDQALAALHRTLTQAPDGAVIITPEVFLPEPPPQTPVGVWADLLDALDARSQRLLVGTALPYPGTSLPPQLPQHLMNVALLLAPQRGEVAASVYAKQRLAPLGEMLPWPVLFEPVAQRWFSHGRRTARVAGPAGLAEPLVVAGGTLGLLICHEVAFGARAAAAADSLVHLASDGWADDARAARQALGLARVRAMESGKWLLSVSEGRPAWLIDPQGRVGIVRGPGLLPSRPGSTPFTRWRDLQPLAPAVLLAALLLATRRFPTPAGTLS